MTDLEITKRCAEAMGFKWCDSQGEFMRADGEGLRAVAASIYNPLHDDTQAMALVKKFGLWLGLMDDGLWLVSTQKEVLDGGVESENKDLNRAICECVAKMEISNGAQR